MIDIFFVNTVINIIWYIFSILFVLYKFTSFFSYIYNFGKFLGQLTQGAFYIKDRVVEFTEHRSNQYITRPNTQVSSQSFFNRIKNKIKSYIWGESTTTIETELPMYTRVSDVSFKQNRNKKEDLHFENCINELMAESKGSFISIDLSQNKIKNYDSTYDSNYESYYDTSCPTSELNTSESQYIKRELDPQNESENVRQQYNIQDSNMLFNSNFIKKNTFKD